MENREYLWVIDNCVYYTSIEESCYNKDYRFARILLNGILEYCQNRICLNDEIEKELKKFQNKKKQSAYFEFFQDWYSEMHYRNKFKIVQQYKPLETDLEIHRKDLKYFKTAFNTKDRILVACEEEHLIMRDKISEELEVEVLSIKEASERIFSLNKKK